MDAERRFLLKGIFVVVGGVIVLVFLTDWFFASDDEKFMTEGMVGLILGIPLGWVGSYVTYHTMEPPEKNRKIDN